jgi:methylenetetrahydrofolate reductase (NADPH)
LFLQDEAFALWVKNWGNLYPEGSRSRAIIRNIHDNYYLVNLVDHEFPKESCLWEIVERMLELAGREADNDDAENGVAMETGDNDLLANQAGN